MKNTSLKTTLMLAVSLLIGLSLLGACSSEDESLEPIDGQETSAVQEDVTITIGNLTDKTGASANAMSYIDMALEDAVNYYNEMDLIPGVHLETIEYDGQYDPSKDIPGYEWLKDRGADLIFTNIPAAPSTLELRVNQDKMVLFSSAAVREAVEPPGYVFNPSTLPEDNAYTLLKWIAEYDVDFPSDGPALIGAAGWATPYNLSLHNAMEEYANKYPDQYTWAGSYTKDMSFNWQTEAEALGDCDYVMLPIIMNNFVKEYRGFGYEGKLLGTGGQLAFLGMIGAAHLWDEFDGSLFILPSGWWTDDSETVNLTKQLLNKYHPGNAESIIKKGGSSYHAIDIIYQMLDIIAKAAEIAGPQNFSSAVLYDTTKSFSQESDGITRLSFTETKRASIDQIAVYEASAAHQDLFRVQEEWYPVIRSLE